MDEMTESGGIHNIICVGSFASPDHDDIPGPKKMVNFRLNVAYPRQ